MIYAVLQGRKIQTNQEIFRIAYLPLGCFHIRCFHIRCDFDKNQLNSFTLVYINSTLLSHRSVHMTVMLNYQCRYALLISSGALFNRAKCSAPQQQYINLIEWLLYSISALQENVLVSLSIVVLNSKDCQGKLWLPKKHARINNLKTKKLSINVLVQSYQGCLKTHLE